VHRHLVAVEVGVVGGADERMELDRLAFDEDRLERLDAEAGGGSGARFRRTGCSRMTSSRMSQTSGRSFSTIFFALLMVVTKPRSSSLL
jgi:hypothetical protein